MLRGMLGNKPMAEWIAQSALSHQHPTNRLLHTLGIPLIVASLAMGIVGFAVPSLWPAAGAVFILGLGAAVCRSRIREEAAGILQGLAIPVCGSPLVVGQDVGPRVTESAERTRRDIHPRKRGTADS